ncbi:MAG: adenylate/guanylate cyclase domain-containing protein [Planctomycetes bacterium]|nr:adenylate/guanylate cyclase domain-containing protein [Planctomycetota bacterium]
MRRVTVAVLIAAISWLAVVLAQATGLLERLETVTLDARHASGLGRKSPQTKIVVAWIDQESMDHVEKAGAPWPWPREIYGQVLEHLRAAGARAVAFDLLFDQHSLAEDERAFAGVLAAGTGDALAMKFVGYRDGGRDAAENAAMAGKCLDLPTARVLAARPRERGLVLPLAEFTAGAERLGFVNITADADGTFRHYDLLRPWGPPGEPARLVPSLALATALAAFPERAPEWTDGGLRLGVDQSQLPIAADARLLLNLRGPAFTFQPVKFVNILESIVRADDGKPPLYPPETFRDAIVLVGVHAEGLEDAHPTPLDPHLPGVELHATALDNLLAGDVLVESRTDLLLAGVAAAVATAVVFALAGVAWPTLVLGVLALAFLAAAAWAWSALLVLPVAAPLVGGGTATGLSFLWKLVVEGRQKREMRRAFQSYLAPEVLAEVLADPNALRLGGETRDVTLFFTDLQGFTSLAEKSEPQQLVAFLNDYFTRMCAPVLAERGVIDKFIGDAIMAIFGAPVPAADQGRAAVHAALAALQTSASIADELRARGLPPIATRIGVHRGQAVVGNMGSSSRFDYTAIGDTVNLAARLEGANKAFGTHCLVSETAWADAAATVLGREVGRIAVVGRKEPIRVFEPLALRAAATPEQVEQARAWADALATVDAADRVAARTGIERFAARWPDDPLAKRWLQELDRTGFTGVFHLEGK